MEVVIERFSFTDAIKFNRNYLKHIEFNNFYITSLFKKIDRKRISQGRPNFLPIKNSEAGRLVDLDSSKKMYKEFQGYIGLSLSLLCQVFSTTFFVVLDWIFFELLEVIARHSRIDYLQEGDHRLDISVNGSGFVANVIRDAVDVFNIDEHIQVLMTNEVCLPRPSTIDFWKIIRIYLLFLLNLYLIFNQVHIHRWKRAICSFFYPKQEKRRIKFLYNKLLKQRKNAFKVMEQKVEAMFEAQGNVMQKKKNCLQGASKALPCLRYFKLARPKCFMCNETQTRLKTKDSIYYVQCQKKRCRTVYCEQCWFEMGRKCLLCKYRKNRKSATVSNSKLENRKTENLQNEP